jgi:Rhodopirellula transposase DDE domain
VTRACAGVVFDTLATVVHLMRKTRTQTGLTVTVPVIKKLYETGRKVAHDFKEHLKIRFDRVLPTWNYRAVPQP